MFDVFIFTGVIVFSFAASWRQFFATGRLSPASYREIDYPDKINFPVYGFFVKTTLPPDHPAV
jgi:hypothetical protein